jgi:hypothetical protein
MQRWKEINMLDKRIRKILEAEDALVGHLKKNENVLKAIEKKREKYKDIYEASDLLMAHFKDCMRKYVELTEKSELETDDTKRRELLQEASDIIGSCSSIFSLVFSLNPVCTEMFEIMHKKHMDLTGNRSMWDKIKDKINL